VSHRGGYVKDQTHLWSKDYDYLAKDILNVQDDVARAVAHEIQLLLTSLQQADLVQRHTVNPEAFDSYLQGYYFFEGRSTGKDADMAARYFERATQLDPSYALAWAWLSRTRSFQANQGLIPMEEGRRESGIFGEGRYAVLTCAYFHTSACRMLYSEVHLFESLEEAQNYKDGLDDFGRSHGTGSTDTYCHAATKGLCSGNHLLVDLAKPS